MRALPLAVLGSTLLALCTVPALQAQTIGSDRVSQDGDREPEVQTWLAPRPVQAPGSASFQAAGFLSVNEDPEGDMPRELAFTADGSAVLIVNRDTDTLTVFDVGSGTITHSVPVGDFPVAVAVAPDNSVAVVTNVLDDTVSIVELAGYTVVATVPVTGSQPFAVAITSDSATAVVAVINDGVSSAFSVIDLGSLAEVGVIPTSPQGVIGFFFTGESGIFGNLFTQFALSPDDSTIVLPDRGNASVRLYDLGTGLQTANLPTAVGPMAVDVSADGTLAVVSHEQGVKTITVIDLVTQSVAVSHSTSANDLMNQVIRITPDNAYAIAASLNVVIFVDLVTGAITSTVSTGTVGDIALSFDGQYAFVSNFNSSVIDLASQSKVATLSIAPTAECAASPVEQRVVGLNNRFREDVHHYQTNGAASVFLGRVSSGEPYEGDAPRTLAVTPDGLTAVVANNVSRNVTLVDLVTGTVTGYADAGDRPLGLAITPDGGTAVVCNGDADTVSIVDLAAGATVATLPMASRPSEVAISPDGSTAFVTTIAGADRVYFVNLAGAASAVTGSLLAGQMGSVGYTYSVISGIAASPAGDVVAACISFDDELLIIDAVTHAELARVPVGDFPIRVAFSADGSEAWVANAFGDSVSVVAVNGAASSVVATVPGLEFPLVDLADDTGSYHFVGNFDGNAPRLHVLDATSHTLLASVPLPSPARAGHYSPLDGSVYLATTGGEFCRVSVAGAASSLASTQALSGGPSDMVFSESLRLAVAAQPGADDGVDLVDANLPVWSDLGFALAGAHGLPRLVGAGTLLAGSPSSLLLAHALENSTFALVAGLGFLGAPFKGGVLVPTVQVTVIGVPIGPTGSLLLTAAWPAGIPSGTTIYMQDWIVDPAGVHGLSASNAVLATAP